MKSVIQNKVAVIGLGNIGKVLVNNFIKGNVEIIIASRDENKAREFAWELGSKVEAKEISQAIQEADIIIPAIHFSELAAFLKTRFNELSGKIIIDVSNPIAPNGNGGFRKIIGENESAGQIIAQLIPSDAIFVKAFGTLGAGSLEFDAFSEPDRKTLFYASDSVNSQSKIEKLITACGFDPLHVGGINQSIRIEVFGDLHEFGRLGKTVELSEGKIAVANS